MDSSHDLLITDSSSIPTSIADPTSETAVESQKGSSSSTSERMPAELVDRLIDFLHDDPRALSNTSLVCKSWLPASTFHLFGHLHVSSASHLQQSVHLQYADTIPNANWRIHTALSDALSKSPRMRQHVKWLQLTAYYDPPQVNPKFLVDILLHLPRLETLHITAAEIVSPLPAADSGGDPPLDQLPVKMLKELRFENVPLSRPLFNLVQWFSDIGTLALDNLPSAAQSGDDLLNPDESTNLAFALQKVNIDVYRVDLPSGDIAVRQRAAEVALQFYRPTMLLHLDVVVLRSYAHPILDKLLAPHNKVAKLDFVYDEKPLFPFRPVDLAYCENLTSLYVGIYADISTQAAHPEHGKAQWNGLMAMLGSANVPKLQSLALRCYLYDSVKRHQERHRRVQPLFFNTMVAIDGYELQYRTFWGPLKQMAQDASQLDWVAFNKATSALAECASLTKLSVHWSTSSRRLQSRYLLKNMFTAIDVWLSDSVRGMLVFTTRDDRGILWRMRSGDTIDE